MKPLQKSTETSQPILTKQDFDKIFLGLGDLHELHANLLNQLEKRVNLWDSTKTIGDVLTILVSRYVLCYVVYDRNVNHPKNFTVMTA